MVDLGVRIWQGVIPENDIVGIQKSLNDALPMQGGINVPAIDAEGMSEEKVRAEVRRTFDAYCENGRFFPGFPGGFCADKRVDDIARDEISKYGRVYVKNHYEQERSGLFYGVVDIRAYFYACVPGLIWGIQNGSIVAIVFVSCSQVGQC